MRWLALLTISAAGFAQTRAIGQKLAAEMERGSKILDNRLVNEYIQKLAVNLAAGMNEKDSILVKVILSPDADVTTYPGGFLFVSTGLISSVQTEAELAGVLAHEIAHLAVLSIPIVLPVCIRFADRTLIPLALQSAKNADEQEADALGVQYVSGAGYDPRGLVDFFERVQPGAADVSAARARIEELSPPPRDYIVTSSDFQRVRERVQLLNPPHRPAAPSLRN